jgi:hypothetical protein
MSEQPSPEVRAKLEEMAADRQRLAEHILEHAARRNAEWKAGIYRTFGVKQLIVEKPNE